MPEILSALWALFVIAAVLALAYAFTRYVAGRIPAVRRGKHITILEQVSIGKDQKLLLVKLGKNIYLLGVTQGTISRLEKFPEDALPPEDGEQQKTSGDAGMNFQDALRKVLEQRKKSGRS